MVTVAQTLGAGRVGIKEFVKIQSEKYSDWKRLVNMLNTTQTYETFKQISDFGYPRATNEGSPSVTDAKVALYSANFTPTEYTLMFGITKKAQFTDQYGVLASYKSDIADTFVDLDALAVANIFNNAFAASGYTGIDGVVLCSTAHPYLSYPTWSNRDSSNTALDYAAVASGLTQMRKVKTARQRPMRFRDGVTLLVPPDLEFTALALQNSAGRYDSTDREDNQLKSRISVMVNEDLSSTTAWFLLDSNTSKLGTFYMEQMPFDVLTTPDWDVRTRTMYVSCYKSFVTGWKHANRIWGSSGA